MYADRTSVNLILYEQGSSEARRWTGTLFTSPAGGGGVGPPTPVAWRMSVLPLTGPAWDAGRPARLDGALFVPGAGPGDDALIAANWSRDGVNLVSVRDSGPILLARIEAVPREHWAVPMAGGRGDRGSGPSPRIVLVWRDPAATTDKSGGSASRQIRMAEVSTLTGRVLYSGPAVNDGLISTQRYRILSLALVGIMGCVLAFVLRTDSGRPVSIPVGAVPAGFVRRAMAAAIDGLIGAGAAALMLGVPLSEALDPTVVLLYDASIWPIAVAIAASIVHCTAGEWLAGRSLGKAMVGCSVVSSRGGGEGDDVGRLALWQALTRNLIRWTVPVVGLFALLEPSGRHPGDIAARTIVVRAEDQGQDPEGD